MIDDPNFIATYYNYLKNMDISDFNIRSIPYTEYQQDLQELSVSPLELFIIHIIETNYYESEYKEYAGSSIIAYNLSKCALFPINSSLLLIIMLRLSLL